MAGKPRYFNLTEIGNLINRTQPAVSIAIKRGQLFTSANGKINITSDQNSKYLSERCGFDIRTAPIKLIRDTIARNKEARGKKKLKRKRAPVKKGKGVELKRKPSRRYVEPEDVPDDSDAGIDSDEVFTVLDKTAVDIERIKAQTRKANLDMAIKMNYLIDVDIVKKFFSELAGIISNVITPMGQRISSDICDAMKVTDEDVMLSVQAIIDKENERAMKEMIRIAKKAIKKTGN